MQPAGRALQVIDRDAVQALAQHSFQRIFPAGLDAQTLPQTAEAVELMVVEPCMHLTRAADLPLQQLERRAAGIDRTELARSRISGFGGCTVRGLALRQGFLDAGQTLALGVVLILQIRELALHLLQAFRLGPLELGLLVLQALASLLELREDALRVLMARR